MSDNQSENSDTCYPGFDQAHADTAHAVEIAAAEDAVQAADNALFQAEEAVGEAKRALTRATGRLWLIKERPTWKQIFVAHVDTTADRLYTTCMQTGYRYVLWNGRIYRAGLPSEQLIDTGAIEADIK